MVLCTYRQVISLVFCYYVHLYFCISLSLFLVSLLFTSLVLCLRWVHYTWLYMATWQCYNFVSDRSSTRTKKLWESVLVCRRWLRHSLLVYGIASPASIALTLLWYHASAACDQYPVLYPPFSHASGVGHHEVIEALLVFPPVSLCQNILCGISLWLISCLSVTHDIHRLWHTCLAL